MPAAFVLQYINQTKTNSVEDINQNKTNSVQYINQNKTNSVEDVKDPLALTVLPDFRPFFGLKLYSAKEKVKQVLRILSFSFTVDTASICTLDTEICQKCFLVQ